MGFCCAGPGRPQGRSWSRGLIHGPRNKHQRCLTGVDEMALSPSAKGLTQGKISAHLAETQVEVPHLFHGH